MIRTGCFLSADGLSVSCRHHRLLLQVTNNRMRTTSSFPPILATDPYVLLTESEFCSRLNILNQLLSSFIHSFIHSFSHSLHRSVLHPFKANITQKCIRWFLILYSFRFNGTYVLRATYM